MVQKDVSLNCVMAWVGWALAIVAAAVDVLLPEIRLTGAAVLFACGAGVLHIRGFIHGLECRERAMFNLGRESGLRRVD